MKKRLFSILCVMALCLNLLPATVLAASPVYMALGDSISTGYAPPLEDGTPQTVYSPFAQQVADEFGYTLSYTGFDGETTETLKNKLDDGTIDVSDADLITVTIGGNDLMNALYEYLVAEYNETQTEAEKKIDVEGLKAALAKPSFENIGILTSAFQNIAGFPGSDPYNTALNTVETNLAAIFGTLRVENPSATILVATQYDPYQQLAASSDGTYKPYIDALKTAFSTGVLTLNGKIETAAAAADRVTVVDVYTRFAESGLVLTNASYEAGGMLPNVELDFHPNQTGHSLIAQTIRDTLYSFNEVYDIWINDVQVTSGNAADVLGNGTVRYDKDTNTLTLSNATITEGHQYVSVSENTAGIYAFGNLTIALEGESRVAGTADSPFERAIYVDGTLTICGGDRSSDILSVTSSSPDQSAYGILSDNLEITDCSVRVETTGVETGVSTSSAGIRAQQNISIQNAEVSSQVSGRLADGILCSNGSLTILNSTVTAQGNACGIMVSDNINVSGSSVRAEATTQGADAISFGGIVTVGSQTYDMREFIGNSLVIIYPDDTMSIPKEYDVWVGGTQITTDNASDVFGDGTVSYNEATNTLTLNGVSLTEGHEGGRTDCDGIYAKGDLNLNLQGTNTITLTEDDGDVVCGVAAEGELDLSGGGVLQVVVSGKEGNFGISSQTLDITGSTLDIKSPGEDWYGIVAESVTVTGSAVTVESGLYAIAPDASLSVNGSQQRVQAVAKVAITADGNVTWSGSYPIWVGDTQVSMENASNVLGDGTVSYDAATSTLTLSGAEITSTHDYKGDHYGIFADIDLNLKLVGENFITLTSDDSVPYTCGVSIGGDLYISGGGSLTVNCSGSESTDGISVWGDLEIADSTITANGTGSGYGGFGLYADNLTIDKKSTVIATSELPGYAANIDDQILIDGSLYQLAADATEFKVVNGVVVSGGGIQTVDALYVNGVNMLDDSAAKPQGVRYDLATNTLTLTNAAITKAYVDGNGNGFGIYAQGILSIELVGNSTVKSEGTPFTCSISADGDLTITGSGSLTAEGDDGIYVEDNLTVNGGSLSGIGTGYNGIYARNLTVNGGSVSGTSTGSEGIYADDLTVIGGSVSGTSIDYGGIGADNLTVNGGSVSGISTGYYGISADNLAVNSGSAAGDGLCGIYVEECLTMAGGSISVKGTMAAILADIRGSVAAEALIVLPEGYLPEGYELKALYQSYGDTLASIVPTGGTLEIDKDTGMILGAVKEITLKAGESTDPGGSTGGGGGSGSGSSGTTTEVTQNPDGSTTTTVTHPDGSTTETTKKPDGSQEVVNTGKDGTVTTTTTDKNGNKTETLEKPDGSSQTTVTNQDGSGSTTTANQNGQVETQVKVPGTVVDSAEEKGETVKLPMPAVPNTSNKETAPTVTTDLPSGQPVKVEIPVENPTSGTVAILVKEDGSEEMIKTSIPSETGVVVTLQDGDKVKIVDNSTDFADVPDSYWGAEAIDFVSSHELMNGIGNNLFAPDANLTRGQLCQILYNLEGMPTAGGSTFEDVSGNAWYADAVSWAASRGIAGGYGNGNFGPNDPITREQLTVMLCRYAQIKGYDVSVGENVNLLSYDDALEVSEYAISAMQWACGAGLISGTGDGSTLSPQGDATRVQVATILMQFCKNVVN